MAGNPDSQGQSSSSGPKIWGSPDFDVNYFHNKNRASIDEEPHGYGVLKTSTKDIAPTGRLDGELFSIDGLAGSASQIQEKRRKPSFQSWLDQQNLRGEPYVKRRMALRQACPKGDD